MLQKRSPLLEQIESMIVLSEELTGKHKQWGHYFKETHRLNCRLYFFLTCLFRVLYKSEQLLVF